MQDARFEQLFCSGKRLFLADRRKIRRFDIQMLQGAATVQTIFRHVGCRRSQGQGNQPFATLEASVRNQADSIGQDHAFQSGSGKGSLPDVF